MIEFDFNNRRTSYLQRGGGTIEQDGTVSLPLVLLDRNQDRVALRDTYQRIQTVLDECRREHQAGRIGGQLMLSIRGSQPVMYYVQRGHIDPAAVIADEYYLEVVVTLECLPVGYGDVITIPESGVITNGDGTLVRIPDVPGSADALVRLYVRDESTNGAVINRLRMGRVSGHDIEADAFTPVLEPEPVGSGSWASDDPEDANPSDFVRVITTPAWQRFATITKPAGDRNAGMLNILPRVRSSAPFLTAPGGVQATSVEGFSRQQLAAFNDAQGTSPTSRTVNLNQPTTEGRLLMALVHDTEGNAATLGFPTGWQIAESEINAGNFGVYLYYYPNNPGDIESVAITSTGSRLFIMIEEWRGADGVASPLDVTASNSEASSLTHPTGTTAMTAQANAIARAVHNGSGGGSYFYTSGWTVTSGNNNQMHAYKILDSTQTVAGEMLTTATASSVNLVAVFKGTEASPVSMPAGTYSIRIVPYDANDDLGQPSETVTITLPSVGAIDLDWNAVSSDGLAGYNVFFKRGVQAWKFFDAGTVTSFRLETEDGATEATPTVTQEPGQLMARIGLGTSGEIMSDGSVIELTEAADTWHTINAGAMPQPMIAQLLDDVPSSWRLDLLARHPSGGWPVDIDMAWQMPHDEPQVVLTAVSTDGAQMALDSPATWRLDLRADGRVSAVLLDSSTGAPIGTVRRDGGFRLRHGDNHIVIEASVQGGVSDTVDAKFVVYGELTPGFVGLRGAY
jgi:hypothetical protein